ncbi:MAG: FAD-binding oxidoreductase [Pseudomonadota bacterium]
MAIDAFATILRELEDSLGSARVLADDFARQVYASDDTPKSCPPQAVVFPRSHAEVRAIMEIALRHRLPLVARGAGSGNVGGALPVAGSVVVSFECMTRILDFDPANRTITVESGVVTGDIDRLARSQGLFYPPDPGSAPYCRIGGNLAMNAAGPKAVKYGVTRDYVLGLRAVTGTGAEIHTGCRTSKGVVGYDLTRLLVGSEGTLALITEATLRLLPAPAAKATLRVCYDGSVPACAAVARVMRQPVIPSALEFMDHHAIAAIRAAGAASDLPASTQALLMVEADGDPADVARQTAALKAALQGPGLLELQEAQDPAAVAALWSARKSLSGAIKRIAPLKINEDVVVPVSRLAELVAHIDRLARDWRIPIVAFGHAGNGNLHVNLMVHPDDADEMARAREALHRLFAEVLRLSGTLSGEHGIGTEKRDYLPLELDPPTLAVMRAIKAQFDPFDLLNPGKTLPDSDR